MPINKTGKKVLNQMKRTYGSEEGKAVFYATMNKYNKKWEVKGKPKTRKRK